MSKHLKKLQPFKRVLTEDERKQFEAMDKEQR